MGRVLAIDYGRKRTGLAVTDPLRIVAGPLETVPTHTLIDRLAGYFGVEQVDKVVVGYPRRMSGEDSETMDDIRAFVKKFQARFPDKEVVLYDERFTSVLAHRAMLDGGMRKKQRQDKAVVDKIAACIILEDYLTASEATGV